MLRILGLRTPQEWGVRALRAEIEFSLGKRRCEDSGEAEDKTITF